MPTPLAARRRSVLSRWVIAPAALAAIAIAMLAAPVAATPTATQLRHQQERATRLAELADKQVSRTHRAQDRLAALSSSANEALDAYVVARDAAVRARTAEMAAARRLDAARQVVAAERSRLGRLAASAYRNGGSLAQLALIASLMESESVTELGRAAADVRWAGTQQSLSVDRYERAKSAAVTAAIAAEKAGDAAAAAEARAQLAKERADRLVAEQRALVAELARQAAATKRAASAARAEAARMATARRIAAQRAAEARAARLAGAPSGGIEVPPGACQGGDISGYANGEIPVSALCPLWGAPGHVLRADAAAAFNAMSKAYAKQFARPILVTDSYRSYEMQVQCRKTKGHLCAVPGTSNHGWGTAVDLGDGVERFGTPTHEWLKQNAPRFGWFHPSWAEPGGSKPEPWHWEFAG